VASNNGVRESVRKAVFRRDNYTCRACGIVEHAVKRQRGGYGYYTQIDGVYLSIDHIHPRSLGGSSEMNNLRVLCTRCNTAKGARPAWPEGMAGIVEGLVMGVYAGRQTI
jgi:5-methylcytosine-specific restriction endonuclease McrA